MPRTSALQCYEATLRARRWLSPASLRGARLREKSVRLEALSGVQGCRLHHLLAGTLYYPTVARTIIAVNLLLRVENGRVFDPT